LLLTGRFVTMVAPPPSGLPGFKPIAPSIWEHVPAQLYRLSLLGPPTEPPFLVLLCTWTGAQYKHIAKYTVDHNVISKTRSQMLDPTYWDVAASRCYFYSDADTVVSWEDIEDHASECLRKGIPTTCVPFRGSEHVRHAEHDWDRYWGAVVTTWKSARAGEEGGFPRHVYRQMPRPTLVVL
jgi:hypothetical protein